MRVATRNLPKLTALMIAAFLLVACELPGGAGGSVESKALPNLTGKGLQAAQDQAQAAGFTNLTSHDSLGRGREQMLDRNWQVCSQQPGPGQHRTDTQVDFGTVKLEEECPKRDGKPENVEDSMVDFTGKSLKAARESLPSNASIRSSDGSGRDRAIIVESNWQVCTQQPAAGAKYDGQPVNLTAVKFTETCP